MLAATEGRLNDLRDQRDDLAGSVWFVPATDLATLQAKARPMLPHHVRQRCEQTIERLLAFLDACDGPDQEGDPLDEGELDPSESEPILGAPETTCEATAQTTDCQVVHVVAVGRLNGMHDDEHEPAECGIGDADGLSEQMTL